MSIKLRGLLRSTVESIHGVSTRVIKFTGGTVDVVRIKGIVGTYLDVIMGTRVSPPLDLSPAVRAGNSIISWTASVPGGTIFSVDVSLDGGETWLSAENSGSIPGINVGDDVLGKELLIRQVFRTTNPAFTPVLHDIVVGLNTYWFDKRSDD